MPIAIRMIPTIPAGFTVRGSLQSPPARNQIHDQDNDGDDEEQVNERAAEVTDETEEPENEQNNKDSPQHKVSFGWFP